MAYSFSLTPEQEVLQLQARKFAQEVVAPIAEEIDASDKLPWEIVEKMAEPPYQWMGISVPEEFGGNKRKVLDICLIAEELGTKSAVCVALIEIASLAVVPIVLYGTQDQKKRLLPRVAKGEGVGCFCLTEPAAGSDAAGIRTVAEKDGDSYVLNGRKRYASFASQADYAIVFAKTDPAKGAKGISAFIVERETPGFRIIEKISCLGMRGHQDEEVILENCRIPKESLLGEEGKGLKCGLSTLDKTRTTLAAGYVGLARGALEEAIDYARKRYAFGSRLADFQAISFPIAEAHILIEAARLLTHRAAWMADQGLPHTAQTAAAKSLASEAMLKATDLAVTVHGGIGCTRRFRVERLYRDAKIWTFAQGTPNILKMVVAREIISKVDQL